MNGEAGALPPQPPRASARATAWVAAGVIALLVAVATPYPARVDGSWRLVPQRADVGELARRGFFRSTAGDLLGVRGGVVRRGGGAPPIVIEDGIALGARDAIAPGAAVRTERGTDVLERVVTTVTTVAPETMTFGVGASETIASTGTPGVTRVSVGEVSRALVASETISQAVPRVVLRGTFPRGPKYIALTFDDGPWPGQTQRILAILASRGARATFFMLGRAVERRPDIARAVAASGNEIGDHSMSHTMLHAATLPVVRWEIRGGAFTIERATGVKPRFYRPAGGSVSPIVYREAAAAGLQAILWTLDPHDYRKPPARTIVQFVVGNAKAGTVVLMHDGGGDRTQTIGALPAIIDTLRLRGFVFVTLSQLYDGPHPPRMPVYPPR